MKITLDNFRSYISERIYWRGVDYFESGAVTRLTTDGNGHWTAVVMGSEDYETEVDIDSDGCISWDCDCPYDWEAMCKHVVAMILAMKEKGATAPQKTNNVPTSRSKTNELEHRTEQTSKPPKNTADDELDQLLKLATKDFLIKLVSESSKCDNKFRTHVMDELRKTYVSNDKNVVEDFYKRIDKVFSASPKGHRTRYDFYDEIDWCKVDYDLSRILDETQKLFDAGNVLASVKIALYVLVKLDEEFDDALINDEDNDIGGVCEQAGKLITDGIDHPSVPQQERDEAVEMLSRLISSELENYFYFDFDNLFENVSKKVLTPEKQLKIADQMIERAPSYSKDGYVLAKIELLEQLGKNDELQATINQYMHLPLVRKSQIEKATEQKRFEEALRLIDDGIAIAKENNHQGTVNNWMEQKMEVYALMGNSEKQIEVCRSLFIDGSHRMERYHQLKKLVDKGQWKAFLSRLIADADFSHNSFYDNTLADIFVEEKDWNNLYSCLLATKGDRLDILVRYGHYLKKTHSPQLITMYEAGIRQYACMNMGRNHYEHIAYTMREMKRLEGGPKAVAKLAQELRQTYPRRRAMIEELAKF